MTMTQLEKEHAQDQRDFKFLKLRSGGMTPTQIARAHDTTPQAVSTILTRIRKQDAEASYPKESAATVYAGYWS